MTLKQKEKIEKIGDRVLEYYETKCDEICITLTYGTKYFCKTFIGVRGGMTNQPVKIYKYYEKGEGLWGFMREYYN